MKYNLDFLVRLLELVLVGFMGIIGYLVRHGYKQGQKDEQLAEVTRKVNILMDSLIRRGSVELAVKGEQWATFRSPLHLGKMAVDAVIPFLDVFIPFYLELKDRKPPIPEAEMFWLFEEKFGDFIVQKICVPNQLSNMGCLIAVVKVCEELAPARMQGNDHASSATA